MNKEMKKNKKMVLALVIVAALAMVSVAAIAIHSDDSAAAGSGQYVPMDNGNPFAIDGNITADYEFYIDINDARGQLPIVISSNANYTGTMTIGTLDKSVSPWAYVPYASMKFTNASNVLIESRISTTNDVARAMFYLTNASTDAQLNSDGVYALTDGVPSGTFELLQGSVQLGGWDGIAFNGAVKVGDFTATSEYTDGLVLGISADGTAQISGYVEGNWDNPLPAPAATVKWVEPTPSLSFSGSASIQFPDARQQLYDAQGNSYSDVLTTDGVEVTIADGAVITAGDRAPSLATDVSISGKGITYGVLFDATNSEAWNSDGNYDINGTSDVITFYDVPLGTYTLFMVANSGNVYFSSVTVTPTGVSLSSNTLPATPMDDVFSDTTGDVTYDAGAYSLSSVYNMEYLEKGTATVDNGTSTGTITFPVNGYSSGDYILAVMLNQTTRIQEVYYGDVSTNAATGALRSTNAATLADDQIKGGDVTVDKAIATFTVASDDVIHIFGTLKLLYVSADQYGSFDISKDAYVNLNVDGGRITQGVAPPANNSLIEIPISSIFESKNLVTAYYYTNDTTGTPATATYTLTSLANAIKESNQITLYGDIVILEDLTLNSPNSDPLIVIIGPDASLTVGRPEVDEDTPAISAILTIPDGTTLVNPTGQKYEVVNGQAVYVNKPTPKSNEPVCDVLISGNNKYIYTDLATALDISSGNVSIDTLRWATLIRNATVQTGVTLNLNGTYGLTVPDKMILTVNGTIEDKAGMTIVGTLMINNVVNSTSTTITLGGSIVIAKDGTLNLKGSILTGDDKSVLVVDGTLNMTGAATGTVTTVTIEGTATITTLKVEGVLRIGAVPELSTGYVNSASITGKLTLDGAKAIAWVYGSFDGTSVLDGDVISTAYMIDATTYLTIYVAKANADLVAIPMVYGDEFDGAGYMLDISISDWNNNRMLRGDFLSDNIGTVFIGGDNWTIVYAEWSAKQYKVTFNYMPGVTWTCNGQTIDSNNNFAMVDYGASISVQVFVQPGYEGTPVIQKDNTAVSGNPYTMTVTGPVTFSVKDGSVQVAGTGTTDNNSSSGLSLIEILLIIIVIIIAIMAIIIAIRLLRS